MADLIGQSIDQSYEIVELLDEGGMAMVYRANDTRLNRTVALKIIPKEKFNKEQLEEILQRFEQEARALAKLSHPNIVPILDCGEHDGSPFLVLEYLSGGTLRKWIEPPLPWQVAVNVMLPIMDALTYCHQHSILHRDIKPSNILFKEDDSPVLTDFGIAKLLETAGTPLKTGTGIFVGTPGYMAPEQHNSNNSTKLDARTDVYQLGIVLYEAITGRRPSDLANIVEAIPHPKEFVPNLPGDVDRILLKALAFKPKDRYQTMEDFKTALQNALNKHPFPSDTQVPLPPKKTAKRSDDKDTPRPSRPLRVYLSYATSDAGHVTSLSGALHQDKLRIRPDKRNSDPGENWQQKIARDVQKSDAVIVCLTKNSVIRNGTLQQEIKLALEKARETSILIIPVRLHACRIPQELSTIKYVDLFEEDGYLKLRSLLAARAKQINANPPLTGALYHPPNLVEAGSAVKFVPLATFFFIALIAILLLYPPFRSALFPTSPVPGSTPTSTPAATEPPATTIPTGKPVLEAYKREYIDRTGTVMLLVTSEEFTLGYQAAEALTECSKYSSNCSLNQFKDAEPAGSVFLEPYYIDKYEVTNSAYQKCVDAKACQPPKKTGSHTRTEYYGISKYAHFPVIHVNWNMAKTYCEWRGARLPTEAEWEKAARGAEGELFPWGSTFGGVRVNFCDKNCPAGPMDINFVDGYSDTAPVTALPSGASEYEIFNMSGNVWEWTSSLYAPYPYDPDDGRENTREPGIRVVRGGSWRDDVGKLFSFVRHGYLSSNENDSTGFRCAWTP